MIDLRWTLNQLPRWSAAQIATPDDVNDIATIIQNQTKAESVLIMIRFETDGIS